MHCRRAHAAEVVEKVVTRFFPPGPLTLDQVRVLRRRVYEDINNTAVYTLSFRMEIGLWLCSELVAAAARLCAPDLPTDVVPVYDIHADVETMVGMAESEGVLWWRVFRHPDGREEEFERRVKARAEFELSAEDELDEAETEEEEEVDEEEEDSDSDAENNSPKRQRVIESDVVQ
jgi:hypothetical protein